MPTRTRAWFVLLVRGLLTALGTCLHALTCCAKAAQVSQSAQLLVQVCLSHNTLRCQLLFPYHRPPLHNCDTAGMNKGPCSTCNVLQARADDTSMNGSYLILDRDLSRMQLEMDLVRLDILP